MQKVSAAELFNPFFPRMVGIVGPRMMERRPLGVPFGLDRVPLCDIGVMGCLFKQPVLIMFCGRHVVICRSLVMLSGGVMMMSRLF